MLFRSLMGETGVTQVTDAREAGRQIGIDAKEILCGVVTLDQRHVRGPDLTHARGVLQRLGPDVVRVGVVPIVVVQRSLLARTSDKINLQGVRALAHGIQRQQAVQHAGGHQRRPVVVPRSVVANQLEVGAEHVLRIRE